MKPFRSIFLLLAMHVVGFGTVRSQQFFTLALDGKDSSQVVNTPATGSGWAILSADKKQLNYTFSFARLTSPVLFAHFHSGARGQTGAPIFTIPITDNYVSGSWTNITPEQADMLVRGRIYLNIHTTQFRDGEIRSQVNPVAGVGYPLALNGNNQNPPISTPARGAGYAVLGTDSTLRYRATVAGLSSTLRFAHFHHGPVGINGNVVETVIFTDSTTTGSWKLSALNLDTLRMDHVYMNVHTANNGGGEIRSQVRPPTFLATSIRQFATLDATRLNVRVTPNPSAELVTMSFALPQSGRVTMRVYDALGRAVSEAVEGVWAGGTASAQFNVSAFNNGVYYCRITLATGETAVQGFVVAR
jgi:hypothetical protein